jgi:AcrR family transcriptional regulator
VAAARQIVAEQGLSALTFNTLEERLSFTRGVVTYHFKSKDEIVKAVFSSAVDDIDATVKAKVAAGATLAEKIRAIIQGNVRGFVDRPEAGRILLSFWGRLSGDEEARRLNAELYIRYRGRCARLLKGALAAGEVKDVDPAPMASLLVGIVLGIAMQHYFDPGSIDVDAAIEEATRTVLGRLGQKQTPTARRLRVSG